jgi:hypothetical protein
MHSWKLKGCKKDVSQMKGKNTIWLRGSTPNHGFIAFEHHGNNLQSSFFHVIMIGTKLHNLFLMQCERQFKTFSYYNTCFHTLLKTI